MQTEDKKAKFWENIVAFQLRHRYPVMIILLLVTILSAYTMFTKLQVKTNFFELYPPKHEYIKLYKEFRRMFGSANVLTMIIERTDDKDIYHPETLEKVEKVTRGIMEIKGCNPVQVSSIAHPRVKQVILNWQGIGMVPLMWPRPKNAEECEKFKKVVYSNEGIRGFYISLDNKSTVIYAGFWEEGVDLSYLFKASRKLAASVSDENHTCRIAGYPMLYAWITHYRNQIYMILGITSLSMIVLLIIYFRSFGGVLIPVVSGLLSAIWGLGFAAAMGINIDPLLLVVPMLLSARALSHSCQCLERFHQEFAESGDRMKALVKAYGALYPPATLAIITDGLGVLTIAIATIPLMQKLAYFSSFWIISIFIAVIILNPIIISFFYMPSLEDEKKGTTETRDLSILEKKTIYALFTKLLYRLSGERAKWVVGLAVIVLLLGGSYISTTYLKVGDSSAGGAILYPDHPYNVAMEMMNNDFAGASRLIVVMEGKEEAAIKNRQSLDDMEKLGRFMQHEIANVGGTVSLADLVRRVYRMYHEGSPKWDMIPNSRVDLGQIFFQLSCNMAPGELDQYISLPDYTNASVTAFLREYNHDSIKLAIKKLKEFRDEVNADPDSKIKIRVAAGILGVLAAVNEEVEWSYWATLIVIFTTIFLLCAFTYRSLRASLILLIPLAVSQVLCELVMLALHIDLNIDSLPVAAIGVGVGIDYGIYLMSRLREECIVAKTFDEARLMALLSTGKVIIFTAITVAFGVGFWIFSVMKFSAEMGLLIFLLMMFNMVCALVLIPALVGIFKPRFVRTIGKEVMAA